MVHKILLNFNNLMFLFFSTAFNTVQPSSCQEFIKCIILFNKSLLLCNLYITVSLVHME